MTQGKKNATSGRVRGSQKPASAAPANQSAEQPATEEKRGVGRPSLYVPEKHVKQVFELCLLGLDDVQIARVLDIGVSTLNRWKIDYPEFRESMMDGKEKADAKVAASLYQRACGYEHPDVHIAVVDKAIVETPIIKKYPPDPQALRFWLMNRQPHLFRERTSTEITGKDGGPIETVTGSVTDYAALRTKIKARAGESS
jgi:hypothetical protein